jgi:hypothetical protein
MTPRGPGAGVGSVALRVILLSGSLVTASLLVST